MVRLGQLEVAAVESIRGERIGHCSMLDTEHRFSSSIPFRFGLSSIPFLVACDSSARDYLLVLPSI